jgi:hypothetical protein
MTKLVAVTSGPNNRCIRMTFEEQYLRMVASEPNVSGKRPQANFPEGCAVRDRLQRVLHDGQLRVPSLRCQGSPIFFGGFATN